MSMMSGRLPAILLQLLLPMKCPVCGRVAAHGAPVCPACVQRTKFETDRRMYQIKTQEYIEEFICKVPCIYRGAAKDCLHRFKFRGKTAYAKAFAVLMAQAVETEGRTFDGLTFVPMMPAKEKARGYNQARLLAEELGRCMALPVLPLLERRRDIQLQHTLNKRQRQANVKNAFAALPEAKGLRLLLVDDVLTTGATLKECAKMLYLAGAVRVTGIAAAGAD